MTQDIDLDAAQAAREAETGPAPTVTFRGATFTLPTEAPYELGERLFRLSLEPARGRVHLRAALVAVLGEEQLAAFEAMGPSEKDVAALTRGLARAWEAPSEGESSASAASSSNGSRPSKRTSSGSTASTSPEPATDPSVSAPAASSR